MLKKMFLLILLAAINPALAQPSNPGPIPISIQSQCDHDFVGQRIAYGIRERIRRSTSMKLSDVSAGAVLEAQLLCLNSTLENSSVRSIHSLTIVFPNHSKPYDYLLASSLGSCGSERIDSCAETMVARIDSVLIELSARIRDGSFKPFGP
jgi:hypothetical protein